MELSITACGDGDLSARLRPPASPFFIPRPGHNVPRREVPSLFWPNALWVSLVLETVFPPFPHSTHPLESPCLSSLESLSPLEMAMLATFLVFTPSGFARLFVGAPAGKCIYLSSPIQFSHPERIPLSTSPLLPPLTGTVLHAFTVGRNPAAFCPLRRIVGAPAIRPSEPSPLSVIPDAPVPHDAFGPLFPWLRRHFPCLFAQPLSYLITVTGVWQLFRVSFLAGMIVFQACCCPSPSLSCRALLFLF